MRRARRLAHRDGKLKFKERTYTNTANGYDTPNDVVIAEVWGSVTPVTAEEMVEANKVDEQYTHMIGARYDTALRAVTGVDHFVTLGTRTFQLVGPPIDVNEMHDELQFKAIERPAAG